MIATTLLAVARGFPIHVPVIVKVLHGRAVFCNVLYVSRGDVGGDELDHTPIGSEVSTEPGEDGAEVDYVGAPVQRIAYI